MYQYDMINITLNAWMACGLGAIPLLMLFAAFVAKNHFSIAIKWANFLCLLLVLLSGIAIFTLNVFPHDSIQLNMAIFSVKIEVFNALILGLVGLIGWVIVNYSKKYLNGDDNIAAYFKNLLMVLASVVVILTSNNIWVLGVAWLFNDLLLHKLLMHFSQRLPAVLAARKRMLMVSTANILLFIALFLLHYRFDTAQIDQLLHIASTSSNMNDIAVLLVLAVILKSAQFPLHGWLLQVMEAPTPVSALLHAGIINIGGFVLIRFASILETSPFAQSILVVIGCLTACIAALVMLTRVSIKVMLAWSTCAQIGFMLLEIGLGAYSLALLHLLAHSVYKAHAFLSSGDHIKPITVLQQMRSNAASHVTKKLFISAVFLSAILVALWLTGLNSLHHPHSSVFVLILCLSFIPLVRYAVNSQSNRLQAQLVLSVVACIVLYSLWHQLFDRVLPSATTVPSSNVLLFVSLSFICLVTIQEIVIRYPQGRLAKWLHPKAFAGFYLDEAMTRLTLWMWPLNPSQGRSVNASSAKEYSGESL